MDGYLGTILFIQSVITVKQMLDADARHVKFGMEIGLNILTHNVYKSTATSMEMVKY
jgi:hypothetical protein